MKKIITISGQGASGKDTFIELCRHHATNSIWSYDYYEIVKPIIKMLGIEGKATKERKLISDILISLENYGEMPYYRMLDDLNNMDGVIFVNIRDPRILSKIKRNVDVTEQILIDRYDRVIFGNEADDSVLDYNYDRVICNRGGLDHLNNEAKRFCNLLDL